MATETPKSATEKSIVWFGLQLIVAAVVATVAVLGFFSNKIKEGVKAELRSDETAAALREAIRKETPPPSGSGSVPKGLILMATG